MEASLEIGRMPRRHAWTSSSLHAGRKSRYAISFWSVESSALQYADHLPSCHTREGLSADQIFLIGPGPKPDPDPTSDKPDTPPHEGELFLVHPPANKSSAEALHDLLRPSVFLAARSLQPSEQWDQEVRAAQRAARASVLMISRQSDPAWYFGHEILTAIALHRAAPTSRRLIMVLLEPGVGVPHILSDVPVIDATAAGGLAGVADRLREQALDLRRRPRPPSSVSPPGDPEATSGPRARSDPFRLYDRLGQLTDAVFEQIVGHAGLDRAALAPRTAPLAERALDVALRASLDSTLYRRVLAELDRRAPWTRR